MKHQVLELNCTVQRGKLATLTNKTVPGEASSLFARTDSFIQQRDMRLMEERSCCTRSKRQLSLTGMRLARLGLALKPHSRGIFGMVLGSSKMSLDTLHLELSFIPSLTASTLIVGYNHSKPWIIHSRLSLALTSCSLFPFRTVFTIEFHARCAMPLSDPRL